MVMPIVVETLAVRPRLLLVDDEAEMLKALTRLLPADIYDLQTASDAETALAMMDVRPPDVIISDLLMSTMSGIDLLRAVRERGMTLPVILLTASPTAETAMQAVEYGAMRYLSKPVQRVALTKAVEDAVRLRQRAREESQKDSRDRSLLEERRELESALTRAVSTLFMAYQPLVSWSKKEIIGYEALVRTAEPKLPHPGALFDAAERLGETEIIGRTIRRLVPEHWMNGAPNGASLFVNLHTKDLNDDDLLSPSSPLAAVAQHVVLEITERSRLDDIDDIQGRIAALRKMGFRIAIDDIGAGYAGLTSFAMLEPDVVKLDMALVRDVDKLPTKQRMIQSMVTLCRDLRTQIVAEGVETAAERDTLVDLGCDLFQGFFFARPGPAFPAVRW